MERHLDVSRNFVTAGARQVHYRQAGNGPVLVLLHASSGASTTLLPLIALLAERFTVIAPDAPGCGASSPLPMAQPEVSDYSAALAETFTALGLHRAHVYGKHAGAKIALAFASAHKARVGHLVLEGLSFASATERAGQLARYAPELVPVWHGGHLLELWHQVRNMGIFFPWHEQTGANRLDSDVASPETINSQVVDILGAPADYRLPFHASFRMDGTSMLRSVQVPTMLLVREGDPLEAQIGRLGPLPASVRLTVFPRSADATDAAASILLEGLVSAPDVDATPQIRPPSGVPEGITRSYVETSFGRLHVRQAGPESARPLLMFHASPGSAAGLQTVIMELARDRRVLAFDTLGHGYSDPAERPDPDIGFYAASIVEAMDQLGLDEVDLFGSHTGALIALEIALQQPERVGRLLFDGIPLFSDAERPDLLENYTPILRPVDDGTHLVQLWHITRDMSLYWPWYRRTREGIRHVEPISEQALHSRVVDTVRSLTTYHLAYRAAFRHPTRRRLPLLRHPALICAGPSDPLFPTLDEAAALAPNGVAIRTFGAGSAEAITANADAYLRFLAA
jgi:pimeloyl-ACP methyl ester carboxylesterase